MQNDTFKPTRFAVLFGAAAMLVALPFQFGAAPDGGLVALKPSMALAKSGSGKDGNGGGDDNSGSGGGSDDDDDGGNSGPGGGSDDDGSDDSDDDRGRRHGGHGTDDTAAGGGTGGVAGGTGGAAGGGGGAGGGGVTKFEVSATGVEVTFSDGTKQEIENGRFQRKNSAGRTVEERPATQADLDRLLGLN